MATSKQTAAARRNVKRAQVAATRKRTIANLPESTRRDLVEQARRGRSHGGRAGHALEDRNRRQLYELAKGEGDPRPLEDGEVGADRGDPEGPLSR